MVPSFFKWAMDLSAIDRYFTEVAEESPLPVVVYNYPSAAAGIDLDSEVLVRLAKHPNIIGTKFTYGNIRKLGRVVRATSPRSDIITSSQMSVHTTNNTSDNRARAAPYFAFTGIADFIAPSLNLASSGAIVGAANVFPRACIQLYNLCVQGKTDEARVAQLSLAEADWALTKRAIPGFKAILEEWEGYGGVTRRPMAALDEKQRQELIDEVRWMMEIEQALPEFGNPTKNIVANGDA
jgi:L-threo-3-deoxy-hexylosonate aldolase